MTRTTILLLALLAAPEFAAAQSNCTEGPEGRVCSIRQPLVNGVLVDVAVQRDLGLITIDNSCSGTLLNRFWVLTAAHCVTTDITVGGPLKRTEDMRITAAWSPRTVIPTRIERRWAATHDIALIYLGAGDFGNVNVQLLLVGVVDTEMTLTKYGRGVNMYATGTGPIDAVPSVTDGRYRSARFTPSMGGTTTYRLPANPLPPSNQVGAGGDSGGPDIATAPNGIGFGIAGVTSGCSVQSRVPSMPSTPVWRWVTNISGCTSAAIHTIRHEIVEIIQEGKRPCPNVSAGCAIPETSYLLIR